MLQAGRQFWLVGGLTLAWALAGCGGSPPTPPVPAPEPAVQIGPAEWRLTPAGNLPQTIAALKPGDTLTLAAGLYPDVHITFKDLHGRADAWITLRGEPGGRVQLAGTKEKRKRIITVDGCSFVRFDNLEVGPDGWDAFKFFGKSSDIVVENCFLHDMGGGGINCSGIDDLKRLRVSHCHIMHTGGNGEGFYLGHQDGEGKSVTDSIIEFNLVHDTGGDQGDGIELNEGGVGNLIRNNVVFNTNYPCIFVENRGPGAPNRVAGNVCWTSNNEALQINGNAVVFDNIVMGGKVSYALGLKGIDQHDNQVYRAGEKSPAEMLALGLTMLRDSRADSAAARAEGLTGEGFRQKLPPKRLAEADGGKEPAADLAERIAKIEAFKPEARAQIRAAAAARIVALIPDRPPLTGYVGLAHRLTQVTVLSGDPDNGLRVLPATVETPPDTRPREPEPVVLPWAEIDDNLLARMLAGLAQSGGHKPSLDDRVLVCNCFALGGWSYQLNGQLAAIRKADPARFQQFQTDLQAMLPGPLPPSEPKRDHPLPTPTRQEAPPQDLAPAAKTQPVADAFAVESK